MTQHDLKLFKRIKKNNTAIIYCINLFPPEILFSIITELRRIDKIRIEYHEIFSKIF